MKNNSLVILVLFFVYSTSFSQVYTNKIVGKKNAFILDSLKVQDYPYALPIWGDKATKKGFQLPYSAGMSVNYFWQQSELTIQNLSVGFNHGPMYNLDEVIRFNEAKASGYALNVRPDIWLFPFLNVYGIFGKTDMATSIDCGIWIPDADGNWSEVLPIHTKAQFDGTTAGLGLTPTMGVGGGWLALDMNVCWTDIPALQKPAMSFVFGPRLGKTFKMTKPETNIAFWAGAFRVHIKSDTNGSLALSDLFPSDGSAQTKVDQALVKVDQKQAEVDAWWNGLSDFEQNKPSNKAKYETANRALDRAGQLLTGLDGALTTISSSTVQYSLEKAQKNMWNFIIGTQYQFNRHFMLRTEFGFLGTRTQLMSSFQYRFGL